MAATKNPPTIKHPTITPKKFLILYKIKSSWNINHMYHFFFCNLILYFYKARISQRRFGFT